MNSISPVRGEQTGYYSYLCIQIKKPLQHVKVTSTTCTTLSFSYPNAVKDTNDENSRNNKKKKKMEFPYSSQDKRRQKTKKKERVFSENFLFVQLFLYFFRSFWIKLCTYHLSRDIDAIITREKSRQGLSVRLSSHSIRIWVFLLLLTVVHGCLASCQVISPDGSRANTHTHTEREGRVYNSRKKKKRPSTQGWIFFLSQQHGG